MFSGAHVVLFSDDAEADRAFFRDVLGLPSVDAGDGWLIFGLPPAEAGIHPAEGDGPGAGLADAVVYFLTDDLDATAASLHAKGVDLTPFVDEPWGLKTSFRLPSGRAIELYKPKHPTAI
ncbi:MAG TPA: VOC family protein [Gaiellaceae bacterium]|jgi:catechol 2,3-dioxygenase-like lactoylglutathione lyase family enzyme|nr:VOC family protein [Gaiellaceae bacterium]